MGDIFSGAITARHGHLLPISMEDMLQIAVSVKVKQKFTNPSSHWSINMWNNEIERPAEVVVKQVANKSKYKSISFNSLTVKWCLEDIARNVEMTYDELLYELQ